jgi:spore maturation protein SpmB
MITLLIGLVALLMAFVAVAFLLKIKRSLILSGIVGSVAGFMLGLFAAMLPGFTRYFGPVEIPDPVIQIGDTATSIWKLCPPVLAVVGLIVGALLGSCRKNNSSQHDEIH